jgi:hypothetical protein
LPCGGEISVNFLALEDCNRLARAPGFADKTKKEKP